MQQDQRDDYFNSAGRRKCTVRIVIVHLLVVSAFFVATFFWGNFE